MTWWTSSATVLPHAEQLPNLRRWAALTVGHFGDRGRPDPIGAWLHNADKIWRNHPDDWPMRRFPDRQKQFQFLSGQGCLP